MRLRSLCPPYLVRRVRRIWFEHRHPDCPWLPEATILFLDNWLKGSDRAMFRIGSWGVIPPYTSPAPSPGPRPGVIC